ncbi:arylsulfatase [Paenibacillus agaridevorans]|uniref:Arylsulfatase n=1 Tax=Paenibacillus agaridevorans TaxID=171404 RepID=A0A2R5EP10_9BACL|nr:sulfatase-like hydrolase/transferase [Paenibacillus agaridevorans]GBG08402.1 arylsulfatase [Paenibacillus agaridevorans]
MVNKPHIVLITTDQMRGDLMGCAGNTLIQTPHIDYLARSGVRFDQAYSLTPVCIPARATIMTGLEGHRLGLTTYKEGFALPTSITLPKLLSDAGYETRVVGKMHVYPERCHYGFDSMLLCEEGRMLGAGSGKQRGYDDYEQWVADQGYPGQAFGHGIANNEYAMSPWHLPDSLHPTEWIADNSCRTIKRRDWTRALFLWASFTAPHPPLTPLMRDLYMYEKDDMPQPVCGDWVDRHSLYHQRMDATYQGKLKTPKQIDSAYRGFYASITQVDRAINRIIGTLREEGILENTWFLFTSDHGDNMGDHGLWFKANFTRGACQIPLIVTPPAKRDTGSILESGWVPGQVNHSPVGLQDILPTCLAIAGLPVPDDLDGTSLLGAVRQPKTDRVRETVLGEFGPIGKRSFMVTDGIWKYIWFEEESEELLFYIEDDPQELHDRSRDPLAPLEEWRNRLAFKLGTRLSDPAVSDGVLRPRQLVPELTEFERAHLISHYNPRGLH